MGSRRRGSTFGRFLEDIVDDTKDFVDDLIDRAKDVEERAQDAVADLAADDDNDNDEADDRDASEAAALREQLDELRAKIDQLTAMQKPAPGSTA